jgi:hypothetical protein
MYYCPQVHEFLPTLLEPTLDHDKPTHKNYLVQSRERYYVQIYDVLEKILSRKHTM